MFTSAGFLLQEEEVNKLRDIRKYLRDTSNPLDLPNSKFMSYFRLSKGAFTYLLNEIKSAYKPKVRSSSVPPILKLAATLSYFGHGSYQQGTGKDFNLGLAQTTVSDCLKETLDIFEQLVCPKWINFNMSSQEKNDCKTFFYRKTGFPGIIGCVDGTHIRIIAPKDNKEVFYNRKGFFSLNAMIVCDHRMIIKAVDAKHGGATHDSLVWRLGEPKAILQEKYAQGERNGWLLGDSGYPLEPWLMTPFRATEERSREGTYNKKHASARNIIERVIGCLKSRFRCLSDARQMHYEPLKFRIPDQNEPQEYEGLMQPSGSDIEEATVVNDAARQIRENILNSIA